MNLINWIQLFAIIPLAIIAITLRYSPIIISKVILIGISFFLALIGLWLIPRQLSTIDGFFGKSPREPNYIAYYLSMAEAVIGILNIILIAFAKTPIILWSGYLIMAASVFLVIYLYFATW